ncbi:hypothetical protein [Frankia sp. KB5]|uniref:hypothetical protein n=1 Tax=Frankia sp. KB5 TaxID=683318 RepID=UPI000A0FC223|nr:hypothetical protein [Frankia sp. KB5]ORT46989.1 hypothetical protein KBI5_22275 [Frankia sp. KB5]
MSTSMPEPFASHPDLLALSQKNAGFTKLAQLGAELDILSATARDTSRPLADRFEADETHRGGQRALHHFVEWLSGDSPLGAQRIHDTRQALHDRQDDPELGFADRIAAGYQHAGYTRASGLLIDVLIARRDADQ